LLWTPRCIAIVEALVLVVTALLVVGSLLVIILVVCECFQEFAIEELDVVKVMRSAARVELPRPKWMARRGAWMA
jgi:hypothetical protein